MSFFRTYGMVQVWFWVLTDSKLVAQNFWGHEEGHQLDIPTSAFDRRIRSKSAPRVVSKDKYIVTLSKQEHSTLLISLFIVTSTYSSCQSLVPLVFHIRSHSHSEKNKLRVRCETAGRWRRSTLWSTLSGRRTFAREPVVVGATSAGYLLQCYVLRPLA